MQFSFLCLNRIKRNNCQLKPNWMPCRRKGNYGYEPVRIRFCVCADTDRCGWGWGKMGGSFPKIDLLLIHILPFCYSLWREITERVRYKWALQSYLSDIEKESLKVTTQSLKAWKKTTTSISIKNTTNFVLTTFYFWQRFWLRSISPNAQRASLLVTLKSAQDNLSKLLSA